METPDNGLEEAAPYGKPNGLTAGSSLIGQVSLLL